MNPVLQVWRSFKKKGKETASAPTSTQNLNTGQAPVTTTAQSVPLDGSSGGVGTDDFVDWLPNFYDELQLALSSEVCAYFCAIFFRTLSSPFSYFFLAVMDFESVL